MVKGFGFRGCVWGLGFTELREAEGSGFLAYKDPRNTSHI